MVHRPRKASDIVEHDPPHWVTLRVGISPLPSGNEQRWPRIARNHKQYQLGGGEARKQSRRVRVSRPLSDFLWKNRNHVSDWPYYRWGVTRFILGSITQPHQLLIEMTVPYSNSSIAVDNIRLIDCFPGKYLSIFISRFSKRRSDEFASSCISSFSGTSYLPSKPQCAPCRCRLG